MSIAEAKEILGRFSTVPTKDITLEQMRLLALASSTLNDGL